MKRYTVRHETHYQYGAVVDHGLHQLRLTPVSAGRQRLVQHAIAITPEPDSLTQFSDHFGNGVHSASIESPHQAFSVVLQATVEVAATDATPPDGPAWETIRDQMQGDGFPTPPEIAELTYPSPLAQHSDAATAYAAQSFAPGALVVPALRDLLARMKADFAYTPGVTDVTTAVSQVMESRAGVCQDFAHVMIAGLRGLGLPARYVSGYLRTYPAEKDAGGGLQGADASHAWVSAWCGPELGWIDCDPTNNLIVGDEHIAVAHGRDFSDVTPLRGVIFGGGSHGLSVAVSVTEEPAEPPR
ncbi:MAG TPA: transglutaminase family protein [Dongiaceae bacterium]|nr:transglutaminase family protein [Dongiaceae bacterium]